MGRVSNSAIVVAITMLLAAPANAGEIATNKLVSLRPGLVLSPSHVNFGPVPVGEPGESIAVTLTNTSAERITISGYSTCESLYKNGFCETEFAGWGAYSGDESLSTCFALRAGVLKPGESCQVLLVPRPSAEGPIHGFFVVYLSDGTFVAVRVKIRGV
jgi:hypothetical protein